MYFYIIENFDIFLVFLFISDVIGLCVYGMEGIINF